MGKTNQLGVLADVFTSDASNNVGIGAAPSGTYKLEVTGTAKVSSTLLVSGAATFSSSASIGGYLTGQGTNPGGLGGSRYVLDWLSGNMRIFSYGADSSTNGGFIFNSQRSDGSNSVNVLSINASGASTFSSSVQITGYVAPSSGAGLELFYLSGVASLFGYDRTNSVYKPMSFGTNNQLYLPINGYVGIGTNNPVYNLDVFSTAANSIIRAGAYAIMQNVATSQAMFGYNITYDATNGWRYINAATATAIRMYGGDIVFHSAASSTAGASAPNWDSTDIKMTIKNGGNVGIGTTSISGGRLVISGDNGGTSTNTQMQVNTITSQVSISCYDPVGSAYKRFTVYSSDVRLSALTSGTVSSNADGVLSGSDGRLKNKTRPLENGLEKVLALVPTYFKWKKDSPFYTEQDYEELGFIAQEVGAVIPEASPEPETNKVKNFHDRAIIAALVKAIQEQQTTITSLQDRLDKAGL